MKSSYFSGVAGLWFVFWIVRLLFGMISNYTYYIYTVQGRTELLIYAGLALLGLAIFLYFYLKDNGGRLAYRFSKDGRCPECFSKVNGSDFCPKCGRDVRQKNCSRVCWNCGYVEVDPSVCSCPKCGREFKKE